MSGFAQVQYGLTRHLRDPDQQPGPEGIEDRRLKIYRELIYNNVEQFLRNGFPVLRRLIDDDVWHDEVRGFLRDYRSASPFFHDISAGYVDWLKSRPVDELPKPFAAQLAHYEWAELALAIADEDPDWEHIDPDGALDANAPALSPTVWCLRYDFPVHKIGRSFQPESPDPNGCHLIVFRDQADKVRFIESNALTHVLLETVKRARLPGREVLEGIAQMLENKNSDDVVASGLAILQRLKQQEVILGSWRI